MNIRDEFASDIIEISGVTVPVAVIGIGCRFPGGIGSAEAYWNFLEGKKTAIIEVPKTRWNVDSFFDADPNARSRTYSRYGGFMTDDVFGFDPAFFDMSPREATSMDPQQRIALQVAYEATQDAFVTIEDLRRARTGVFLGISTVDFAHLQRQGRFAASDIFAGTGAAFSIAANRISHRFGLNGPSLAIDTACSSALVAVDQAVRHLTMGTCEMALAGGVNCMLDPGPFVAFSGANMLSKSGGIYTFDDRADGFIRGEGCGIVLLKQLDRAIADGDRIYGVIRQTMVNQDGYTSTITAPNGDAQQAMLQNLMQTASVDPNEVDYVEAHGTGTPVGDPIEAIAIGRVFGSTTRKQPLHLGSFKPNIGHLESAAGIAGFIKALMIAERRTVLPNRNFETPNPDIPFDAFAMKVPTELAPIGKEEAPVLTAVNSFGFGGTNACVLIEQKANSLNQSFFDLKPLPAERPVVFPISSPSIQGLSRWASGLAEALGSGGVLSDVSIAQVQNHLQTRRDYFAHRASIVAAPDRQALRDGLLQVVEGIESSPASTSSSIFLGRASERKLGMVFSGQGGQWWGMARRLLLEDKAFRATVERVDEVLRPLVGWSTVEEMLKSEKASRINTAEVTQAAIFATQMALFEHWERGGLQPDVVTGHSFGEVAAACSTGYIDLEDAARLISLRGQIPKFCSRRGAMAAVGLTVDQLRPILQDFEGVIIGAFNGPVAQTISGEEEVVIGAMSAISSAYPDVLVRRMQMDFAWHSELLDDVKDWFVKELGSVEPREGRVPMVSTVTGKLELNFDEHYWWENLRQPVSFTKAIELCMALGTDVFLELGPHRTLTPLSKGIAQSLGKDAVTVTSLDRTTDDFARLAAAEAELFVAGVDTFLPLRGRPVLGMPGAQWSNEHLRVMSEETESFLFDACSHPLLGRREFLPEPAWSNEITISNFRYLADHTVGGDILFPAVGYIEMMGAAIRDFHGAGPVELRDFKLHQATSISNDDVVLFSTTLDPVSNRISISTMHRGLDDVWHLRAEAYGFRHDYELTAAPSDLIKPGMTSVDSAEFYRLTERHGLQYGPEFRLVQSVKIDEETAVAEVVANEATPEGYFAFPGVLDSALQASIAVAARDDGNWQPEAMLPADDEDETEYRMRLPVGARKILLKAPLSHNIVIETSEGRGPAAARLRIFSSEGQPLIQIEDLTSKVVGARRANNQGYAAVASVFEEFLERQPSAPSEDIGGSRWLLLGDGKGHASLAAELERRGAEVDHGDIAPFTAMDLPAATRLIEQYLEAGPNIGGIVLCTADPVEASSADGILPDIILDGAIANARQLTTLGQVCETLVGSSRSLPRIAVITRSCRMANLNDVIGIDGLRDSPLLGMGRTLANELHHSDVRLIDADVPALSDAAAIVDAMTEDTLEREFVIRATDRYVARLESKTLDAVKPALRPLDTTFDESNFRVTMSSPGSIDNIVLREVDTPECGPAEILVRVAAVGLNFRDIMAATSILPGELEGEDAYWRNLGLEFSGTVIAVGPDVTHLSLGDKVMGMGKGFLRRFAKTHAHAVMRLPADFDLQKAATMPVAFLTAHYALADVGQLDEAESVLIHLASGGVGLAAIQVAKDRCASRIFGTAGSDAKRAHVEALGVEAVMNSRSLEFSEELLRRTGGDGVDVVLNALSGAGIDKSLECLAPFGRMVEIGKRDLADDKPIGLGSLYRNNAYSVIDLSTLPTEKPKRFRKLLAAVEQKIALGSYQPLPATIYPVSRTSDAMRALFQAQHIGKIVVTLDEPVVDVQVSLGKELALSPQASYLVTGGLKGFGVVIGDWLSQRGAGTVVLANRTGTPDDEAAEAISRMEERGTNVLSASLDVSDVAAVERLIAELATADHPLRGIVHGAAVIEDAFISQIDGGKLDRVITPKVAGAINLHNAALRHEIDLDFFLNMSSIAEMVGSSGQINYTAANSLLNAMSTYRKNRGLAAVSVAWGAISGSGFVSRSESLRNYLESAGIKPIEAEKAVLALDTLLRADSDNLAFANLDWTAIGRANPGALKNPRLKPLLSKIAGERSRLQQELISLPRERWEALLSNHIRTDLAKVLKVDEATIADDRKLSELGLDSLSAFELKNRIEASVDLEIPIAQFIQAPTIERLAALVAISLDKKLAIAAAAAQNEGNGSDTSASGARFEYKPLARQLEALEMSRRPMSTSAAIYDAQLFEAIALPHSVDLAELRRRLILLARANEVLCLSGSFSGNEARIERGAPPEIDVLDSEDSLPILSGEGHLWRFGLKKAGDGPNVLEVRAHRAAADALSVHFVANALCAEDFDEDIAKNQFSYDRRRTEAIARRDIAYWKETLRQAPSHVPIHGRRRPWNVSQLGKNRVVTGVVTARLSGLTSDQASEMGQTLLPAFVRALADSFAIESIILDNWFTSRNVDGAIAQADATESFFPLILSKISDDDSKFFESVNHTLAQASKHQSVDTPQLERQLGDWLASREVDLRQFGFAWLNPNHLAINERTFDWLEALPLTLHDVQLAATCHDSGITLRMAVDLDVFDRATASHLLETTVANTKKFVPTLLDDHLSEPDWQVIEWPSLPMPESQKKDSSPFSGIPNFDREVPFSAMHNYFINVTEGPGATDLIKSVFTISNELIVRPQMDLHRLESAVMTVIERHDALRTRFLRSPEGNWLAYLEKNHRPEDFIFIEELSDEVEARDRAAAIAREAIEVTERALRIHVLRFADEGDLIVSKAHHSVVDGYSLGLIMEEVVQSFIGLPLPPVGITTEQYYDEFYYAPGIAEARELYLQELFADPPPVPKLGRTAKGLTPNHYGFDAGIARLQSDMFDNTQYEHIKQMALDIGCTVPHLVIGAFGKGICKFGGVDEVVMVVPHSLRHEKRLEYYVNCVTSNIPVRVRASEECGLAQVARNVAEGMDRGLAVAPFQLGFTSLQSSLIAQGSYTSLFYAGEEASNKWVRGASSAPLQRPNTTGEFDMGMYKITNLPRAIDNIPALSELALRTYPKVDGLGIAFMYDTLGMSADEAEDFLTYVKELLRA
jgi:acyl transferase domain-containing protein/NAD(P)-dependent dehydrogenase (short-subunit alcohol dehydrogenase family)/acyl carrier protein